LWAPAKKDRGAAATKILLQWKAKWGGRGRGGRDICAKLCQASAGENKMVKG